MFGLFKSKEKSVTINPSKSQKTIKSDISEPILTIVRLLKEDRERFQITQEYNCELDYLPAYATLCAKDKINGRKISVARGIRGGDLVLDMDWATEDEKQLLTKTLIEIYNKERELFLEIQKGLQRLEWLEDYQDV